jgi:hypothetical protein
MAKFRLEGREQMRAKLTRVRTRFPKEYRKAMQEEMKIELAESNRRTPIDTGDLRNSGRLESQQTARSASVEIVYGSDSVDYAVTVHEDLEAFHRVGQAKFLESTLNESEPHMGKRIARRINIEKLV